MAEEKEMHIVLKEKGNKFFQMGKYDAAIDAYTEALCLSPGTAIYVTNRALCHFKKENYEMTIEDCDKAIELDGTSVKAHYFKGLALEKKDQLKSALVCMERALDICNMQGGSSQVNVAFVNEIRQMIRDTKKKRATLKLQERLQYHSRMRNQLAEMMQSELAATRRLVEADPNLSPEEKQGKLDQLAARKERQQKEWDEFFLKVSPTRRSGMEVPDFLCCKISMDLCADPCVTPYGINYDREMIEGHLRRGNNFDPITRKPLAITQLYPNLALRQAIDCYYDSNPWADDLELDK